MDYPNYDDYMRSVLGNSNMNCPNMNMSNTQASYQNMYQSPDCLEGMYPDTYRIVYPMVISACNTITMPVTEEMLDRMTDDIYDRAVTDNRINIDINIEVENRENSNDRQFFNNPMRKTSSS